MPIPSEHSQINTKTPFIFCHTKMWRGIPYISPFQYTALSNVKLLSKWMRLFTENSKRKRITTEAEWNSDIRDIYCARWQPTELSIFYVLQMPQSAVLCYSRLSVGSTKSNPTKQDFLSLVSVHMYVEFNCEFANISHTAQFWDRITSVLNTRGDFRPRQTRQLPRAVDLKGRLLSCQNY